MRWSFVGTGLLLLCVGSASSLNVVGGPSRVEEVRGLLKMARLKSVPMGAAAVGIGAFGARHLSETAGPAWGRLALGTALTSIVTAGSMLINDYHDFRRGVDTEVTKPGRPMVTGQVRPETVKFVLKWAYALHLTLLCLVDSAVMRLGVLLNTLLTYLYSVHLKPVTGLKNVVCATIIAMAVGLGAVAQAGGLGLRAVWRPMAVVCGLIWHRELLMDIKDVLGDAIAGVRTVPVVLGRDLAFLASLLPLAAAAAAACGDGGTSRSLVAAAPLLLQGILSTVTFTSHDLDAAIEAGPFLLLVSLLALTSA